MCGRVSKYYSFKNLLTVEENHDLYIKLILQPNLFFSLESDGFYISNNSTNIVPNVLRSCLELLYNIDNLLKELEPCKWMNETDSANRLVEFLLRRF